MNLLSFLNRGKKETTTPVQRIVEVEDFLSLLNTAAYNPRCFSQQQLQQASLFGVQKAASSTRRNETIDHIATNQGNLPSSGVGGKQ